jgi:hypothetical protein
MAWFLTMALWIAALVIFRAPSLQPVLNIYKAMAGYAPVGPVHDWTTLIVAGAIATLGPSSQTFVDKLKPWPWLVPAAGAATAAVLLAVGDRPSYEFIYFHF